MACSTSSSSSPKRSYFCNSKKSSFSSARRPQKVLVSSLVEKRVPYNPLVFQAANLLGPPARFEASKLKVVLMEDEMDKDTGIIPRTYALSHCDFTANLTLAISNVINLDQLKGWYNRDDVVAEWNSVNEETCLHVHCHVSGPNVILDLLAQFRYHIFSKELPLVLAAILYGDALFFRKHPELMDALVLVYFHSSSKRYNRVECWGPLKDASLGKKVGERHNLLKSNKEDHRSLEKPGIPKSIFQALVSFLL
ncbi:magnesium dechelatase [Ranunculus cassubicifolius]